MHANKQQLFDQVSTFKGFINHLAHSNNSNLIVSNVHNVKAGKGYSQSKVYIDVCKKGEWVVTITIDMSNYRITGIKTLGSYPKKQADNMINEATSFYFDYISEGFNEINGVNAAKKEKEEAEKQRKEYIDSLKSKIYFDFLYDESLMDQVSNVEYYNNFITSHNVTDEEVKEIIFNHIKRKYKRAGKDYISFEGMKINECNEFKTNNNAQEEVKYTAFNDQIKSSQPVTYHFYKQSFDNYMDAYNYAINNKSPVTMVIASNHPSMTNERLQQLEYEYTFEKSNMSYNNMKEYFSYISSLKESLDQQERYYKLKSYIQRYEYKQQQKENREEHLRDLMREACTLLHFMKKKGLQLINKSDCGISSTKYIYNNNVLHFDVRSNGIPIDEYHTMIHNIFNNHFSDYINEYNQYTLYWYYMPDGNTETLTQIDSYVFIDSTIGEHGIIAYDRQLTDSEINKYKLVTCNYCSDQSII